jgi:hypothetical protein
MVSINSVPPWEGVVFCCIHEGEIPARSAGGIPPKILMDNSMYPRCGKMALQNKKPLELSPIL